MECTAICFHAATTVPSWRASSRLTPGARPRTYTPTRGGSQAPPFAEERITELKERLEHAREQKQTAEHGGHRSLRSPSSSATPSAATRLSISRSYIVQRICFGLSGYSSSAGSPPSVVSISHPSPHT